MFGRHQRRNNSGPATSTVHRPETDNAAAGDHQWLTGLPLWALFLGICLTSSLITVYVTIIATALPSITAEYNTISDLDWYSTAYLLCLCAMQPLAGKIFTYFPLKPTYIVFIATFEAGNLICALAPTSPAFIVGRAIAGLGGAGLFNGSMVMLTAAVAPTLRPTLIAFGVATTAIGGVVGPVIGGAITQSIGWRWCLWIFLPPGALAAAIFLFVPIPEQTPKAPVRSILPTLPDKLDLFGFALFAPLCVMALLALSWGGQKYNWSDAKIIGLFCGAGGTAILFGFWQNYRKEKALIPPGLLKKPVVFYGCLMSFLQGGAFLEMGYYLPLWFQSVKRASPLNSGLMLLPTMVAQIVASGVCGGLVNVVGRIPPWALMGNGLSAIGSGLMTTFLPSTSEGKWIGYQILVGIGRGLVLQMPIVALQGVVSAEEIASATALTMFCQYFGGTVFLAIAKTIFENELRPALRQYAPGVDPDKIINAGATNLFENLLPGDTQNVTLAYNKALAITFWLPTAAAIIAFLLSHGLGWQKVASIGKGARGKAVNDEEKERSVASSRGTGEESQRSDQLEENAT